MAKYKSKPIVIEAVQLRWHNWSAVCELLGDVINVNNPGRYAVDDGDSSISDSCGECPPYIELTVTTVHGEEAIVRHGDWIIPEAMPGRFYPCKPDVFAAKYELVEE